ncbi:MAG: hypothetical protein SRB1_00339 [Desulfobacteraceae bacterium Eth-SRB1]|nr:MAG: hypothetical protein SRB1_00339 [Desulfobacteraceae bacterium Eth-SRB1]
MKKYLIVILTLLFVGCSSIPIKSDNGSFRNSLKSKYYKKADYIEYSKPSREMLNNVDIDEVVRRGLRTAYLSNIGMVIYIRLNKDGLRPSINDDKLWVFFNRIYADGKIKGFKITICEELPGKKCFNFVTYQEIFINKKGEFIIRENISKKEATRKRVKWDDTRI